MAETRDGRPAQRGGVTPQPDDRKHLTRVGSLLFVVLGSLLLGAVLQQDEETPAVIGSEVAIDDSTLLPPAAEPAPQPSEALTDETARPTTPARPDPTESPAPGGALTDLARRASVDFRRLPREEAWMLQLAAICDAANVERLVRQVADRELHVLPVEIGERACFRLCWGPFASRSQAVAAAAGLPAPIRSLSDAPQPRLAASLIP